MDIIYWGGVKDVSDACVENGDTMRVLKNNRTGSFTGTTYCVNPYQMVGGTWIPGWSVYATIAVRLADMNGDGFVDIVTGEASNYGHDRVVFNNGDGTFNFRHADDTLVK